MREPPETLRLLPDGVVFLGVTFFLGAAFAAVELDWVVELGVREPEDMFALSATW